MSSAELLDLLDGLPDTSRYKGALRGYPFGLEYEWAPEEYRQAAMVRQVAPLDNDGSMTVNQTLYHAYFSPRERQQIDAQQQHESDRLSQGRQFIQAQALGIRKAVI